MRSESVRLPRRSQAFLAVLVVLLMLIPGPAAAIDLLARHHVTVEFATADGKPLADAEVRVFAPGKPTFPARTGRTDSNGKFEFPADEEGFWTAEARAGSEIARATVRVGTPGQRREPVSPIWVIGGLFVMLLGAIGTRVVIARRRAAALRRNSRGSQR